MWTLDVSSGELAYEGNIVGRLNQSETLILSSLVTNNDLLVSKDFLLSVGWPNKFVAPNSLNAAIKNIRQLLSCKDSDIFIETVHRKGYILRGKDESFKIVQMLTNKKSVVDETILKDRKNEYYEYEKIDNYNVGSQYVSKPKNEEIKLLKKIKLFSLIIYTITTVVIAIFISAKPAKLFCVDIQESTLCGLSELGKKDIDKLRQKHVFDKGFYYYGYDGALNEIKIYRYN